MLYLFKKLFSRVIDKSLEKILHHVVSCVVRCTKHPFEHRDWCKENPKAMKLVDTICISIMEAKRGRVARREGPPA